MKSYTQDDKDVYTVNSRSKCLDIPINEALNAYVVTATFFQNKVYAERVLGIIDTGASSTIISIRALFGEITDTQYKVICDAIAASGAYQKPFSSAAGVNDINSVLCIIPRIKLNDMEIRNFAFYLVDNRDRPLFLLGNDFISNCDLAHIRGHNMVFYNYNKKKAQDSINGLKTLNLFSLEK